MLWHQVKQEGGLGWPQRVFLTGAPPPFGLAESPKQLYKALLCTCWCCAPLIPAHKRRGGSLSV